MSQDWRRASLVYNTQCHNMRQPSVGLLPSSQQGFAGLMCNMLVHNTHLRHAADLFPRPVRLSLRTGCGPRFVIAHHWLEQSSFSFRVRDSQESVCSLTAFSSRDTAVSKRTHTFTYLSESPSLAQQHAPASQH